MQFLKETLSGTALKSLSGFSPVILLLAALALAFVGYLLFDALYWRQRIRRINNISKSTRMTGNGDGTPHGEPRRIVMRSVSEDDAEQPRRESHLQVQPERRSSPGTAEVAHHIVIQWRSDEQPPHRAEES